MAEQKPNILFIMGDEANGPTASRSSRRGKSRPASTSIAWWRGCSLQKQR